jgi:hypothetical protein
MIIYRNNKGKRTDQLSFRIQMVEGLFVTYANVRSNTAYMHQPKSPFKPKAISLHIVSYCTAHVSSTVYAFQKVAVQYFNSMDSNI